MTEPELTTDDKALVALELARLNSFDPIQGLCWAAGLARAALITVLNEGPPDQNDARSRVIKRRIAMLNHAIDRVNLEVLEGDD